MALAIRGVAFDLDGETLEVLHDVDLEVAPGDFVAILGPSGCGKSTLLRLAAGLDRPREGTILADGVPIEAPDPSRVAGPDAVSLADGGGQCLARPGGARPVEEPSRAH